MRSHQPLNLYPGSNENKVTDLLSSSDDDDKEYRNR